MKLDCDIVNSSLWAERPEIRIVFLTMLALCDSEGLCRATAPGIARRANIGLKATRKAILRLESPDEDDRSGVAQGRRIQRVPGGYMITNYVLYRERDYGAAERMRKHRLLHRNVTPVLRPVTQAEAEAEVEAEGEREGERDAPASTPKASPGSGGSGGALAHLVMIAETVTICPNRAETVERYLRALLAQGIPAPKIEEALCRPDLRGKSVLVIHDSLSPRDGSGGSETTRETIDRVCDELERKGVQRG